MPVVKAEMMPLAVTAPVFIKTIKAIFEVGVSNKCLILWAFAHPFS